MKSLRLEGSREIKKKVRGRKVNAIVVTVERTDGTVLTFDGDEESQKRLDRFSRRMRANGQGSLPWMLADNTVAEVTVDEMEEALDKAMQRQGELWFLGS